MAFLPTAPVIIPEIATGAAQELSAVRDAALSATEWACDGAEAIGVLTGEADPPEGEGWSLDGFGVTVGDGTPASLHVGMARWFLQGRPATVVGPSDSLREFDAVLVMGDASASRTDKAPRHFDPRALAFDTDVVTALGDGDAAALAHLDLLLAQEFGADGAPAWAALARQVGDVTSAVVDDQEDPFGVLYVVARWTVRWAAPA